MRTRIKICGITSEQGVGMAVSAGADALGFNMYERSPRFVDTSKTAMLLERVPPFISTVGLFVDHSSDAVEAVMNSCVFDLLQFHGDEENDFCRSFGIPFIKAVRVGKDTDIAEVAACFPNSIGIMLDARVEGQHGGTGVSFDWSMVPVLSKPVILAGGLTSANVADAVRMVKPYGVDVSSGVESSPGVKDGGLVESFVNSVTRADSNRADQAV